jgi:hypothetical protein
MAQYVHMVMALLGQAGILLSPRRANMLYRATLAVNAAAQAMDPNADLSDATLLALRSNLPSKAQGLVLPELKILAAHKEAMRSMDLKANDPMRLIMCTNNALERLKLAVKAKKLSKADFSQVVADALAQLGAGSREAAIVHLFETGAVGRLNAAIAAQAGEVYRDLATPPAFSETLHATNPRYSTWGRVKDLLSKLNPSEPRAHLLANAMAALFAKKKLQTPHDAERAFAAFVKTDKEMSTA